MDVKSGYDILRPDYLGHTQSQSQSQSPPLTRPPNRRDPGTSIRSDHASLSDPTAPGPRYGTSTQTGTDLYDIFNLTCCKLQHALQDTPNTFSLHHHYHLHIQQPSVSPASGIK
ncbi:hypothetical protein ONS96_014863 [Cadophora gregata f. sp. sojae]|nr:hypothetical protein ONS96_014863 [Cadophora gregata f. sp. sojae]